MAAESLPRRLVKKYLVPLLGEGTRQSLQALAMAKDILDGSWVDSKEPEVLWARALLKPGETVIDIGANYGLYTYHASKAVGPSGRVYAFEPVPFTVGTLRKVCSLLRLKNVDVIAKGCSDEESTLTFSLPMQKNETLSAGLAFISVDQEAHDIRNSKAEWEHTSEIQAPVIRVDDYLSDLRKLRLIKVDIEGADLLALRGARSTIEKHRPAIIMEVEPRWYESYGISSADIAAFFSTLNYEMFKLVDGELASTTPEDFDSHNRVFLPCEFKHKNST